MKQFNLIFCLLLIACGIDKKNTEILNSSSNEEISQTKVELQTIVDSLRIENDLVSTSDSLLSYFNKVEPLPLDFTLNTNNSINDSYSIQREIPFSYQPIFEGHLYPMSRTSTGYLPKDYYQINDSIALLIIFIQDDYGPVYHGLAYNTSMKRILSTQILAREWGDAGDSQTIYSKLKLETQTLKIDKFIKTCHAELDIDSDPVKVISEECTDSTYIEIIK